MPFHGDVRDFGVVLIGAGPAGTTAAELDGVLGYSTALVEQTTSTTHRGQPDRRLPQLVRERRIARCLPRRLRLVRIRDREVGEQFRQATLERIGERGLHLIHGERWLAASRSGGTCSSLAWFSSVWRSRSIRFR